MFIKIKPVLKSVPIVLLLILNLNLKASETGKISGKVIDKNTKETIIGASIILISTWEDNEEVKIKNPPGGSSDIDGRYFILNLRPGTYSVICFAIGYKKEEITKVVVKIDKSTELNFELEVQPLQGEEVVVSAFKPNKVEKDLTATKQTYNISEIETIAGISNIDDVLELQADVVDNHFRGGRSGESLSLIGGSTINNPLDSRRAFQPSVRGLQTVEVLTSGFSAEYGNAQSGVINMVPKEGGEKWNVSLNAEMDLPHYQVWGGNPYSTESMPFYNQLSNPAEWLTYYLADGGTKKYIIGDFSSLYQKNAGAYASILDLIKKNQLMYSDSLRAGTMAAASWLQMARRVGLENNEIPFKKFELTAGGPVSSKMNLFILASQIISDPIVTVAIPDLNRQLMANASYQIDLSNKIVLSYIFDYSFKNSVGGPTNWFDEVMGNAKTTTKNMVYGINWTHIYTKASFMNMALRALDTYDETRPEYLDPGQFQSTAFNGVTKGNSAVAGNYTGRNLGTPTGHSVNDFTTKRGSTKTKTFTFDGNYSTQINAFNLLKSGWQFQYYSIDNNTESGLTAPADKSYSKYKVNPYEGALYIQDKMEFEGFIANIGLRYDFYNFNMNYYSNIFTPLFNPQYPDTGKARDPEFALKDKTTFSGRIAPRLGISFPISEDMVFHLNYGTFLQRPPFNYVLTSTLTARGNVSSIGNPTLKPEKTSAWDVGIVYALPGDFRLDLSAYYKDVNDLVEQAVYINSGNEAYTNYTNRDYANIKGFNVNMERNRGFLNFYLRYNYQIAKGKASAPGDALVTIYETPLSNGITIDMPNPRDVLMDYDITHRLIANVSLQTDKQFGPELFGTRPLSDLTISATFKFQTGQPYTDDDQLLGLVYNKRMPNVYDLKMRIQKSFSLSGYRFIVYLEGFNILNFKEFSTKIFSDKLLLERWKHGEKDGLIWYDGTYAEQPNAARWIYQYSDANSIYKNQPRYFRLGLRVQM